jgi:hypothetical protein
VFLIFSACCGEMLEIFIENEYVNRKLKKGMEILCHERLWTGTDFNLKVLNKLSSNRHLLLKKEMGVSK